MSGRRRLGWLLLACLAASVPARAAASAEYAEYAEDFSGVPDGTPLQALGGWAPTLGAGTATVLLAAGFRGPGLRFTRNEQYRRDLGDQAAVLGNGEAELRLKIRIATPAWARVKILVGQNDGVNGLSLQFAGGKNGDAAENFVRVSTGGQDWGHGEGTDVAAHWAAETWYEVVLSRLRPAADGKRVEGLLAIRALPDGPALVEGQPVRSFGRDGALRRFDALVIGNGGTNATFDVDELSLAPSGDAGLPSAVGSK